MPTHPATRSALEAVKGSSDGLRGDIARELATDEPTFTSDTAQVLKFHGIYNQDDRDVRRERQKAGLGKDWRCMVRAAVPGGVLSAEQYLAMDALADEVADGTLRITTRQGIQYHFVRKGDLHGLVRRLNQRLVTTLSACGDVARNVMCCPAPRPGAAGSAIQADAALLARHLKPASDAYWQLWVDGERAASLSATEETADGVDPLYGPTYLPRKFKISLAYPGDNCVDVFTHDIGLVPRVAGDGVSSYTVLVGGGLGQTHNNPDTYPRLAEPLGDVSRAALLDVVRTIVGVQRDHGDRGDRKQARMKYLVADWGIEAFRAEVERRLGWRLATASELEWSDTDDHLGWQPDAEGRYALGLRVESGRLRDGDVRQRTGVRRVVERYASEVRLTPRQDLLLGGIAAEDRTAVEAELTRHGVRLVGDLAPLDRFALACPALPTCGLALAEAERALPGVLANLHGVLAELGLSGDAVHLRVTGCPNGCARPYSTEVGVVGRGKDRYTVYLGGNAEGTRLAVPYADRVGVDDLPALLRPVLAAWGAERLDDEAFGDFCDRVGIAALQARFDLDSDTSSPRKQRDARDGAAA